MRYSFKLIFKWLIILSGLPIALVFITSLLGSLGSDQSLIYKQLIVCITMPTFALCAFLIAYVLYKKGRAKKYELFLPLFYWSVAMPLVIYKKVQTDLVIEQKRGDERETA